MHPTELQDSRSALGIWGISSVGSKEIGISRHAEKVLPKLGDQKKIKEVNIKENPSVPYHRNFSVVEVKYFLFLGIKCIQKYYLKAS